MKRCHLNSRTIAVFIFFALVTLTAPKPSCAEIPIYNLAELQKIGDNATTLGGDYVLMNDLDATPTRGWNDNGSSGSHYGFNPIGTIDTPFTGSFNGNGHVIRNLYINRPDQDHVALFGWVQNSSTVSYLGLDNATVRGRDFVGVLVGQNYDGEIAYCSSAGTVTGNVSVGGLVASNYTAMSITASYSTATVSGVRYVGGLVGDNSGTITACYGTGAVQGEEEVGGLVGLNAAGVITGSYSTGAVTGTTYHAGGLVGWQASGAISKSWSTGAVKGFYHVGGLAGGVSFSTVQNCYSTGAVIGTSDNIGGLAGYNDRSTIVNCYSAGAVSGPGSLIGGLVGSQLFTGSSTASFWDLQTSGQTSSAGGTGKSTPEMKAKSTFTAAGWDFENIWGICSGLSAYPSFRDAQNAPVAVSDAYETDKNMVMSVTWPNILTNDSDLDCDNISAIVAELPLHGLLALNANGSFTYAPDEGFTGVDFFTYMATDGMDNSTPAAVYIAVGNSAPAASADSYDASENTPLSVAAPGVLGNDTDPDNDSLTAILDDYPAHGTLAFHDNGAFTYTPAAGYRGADSFTYRATDKASESTAVTVTLSVGYDGVPAAVADTYATARHAPLSVAAPGVLGNDSDPGGDSITARLASPAANGAVTLSPDGSFTYVPEGDFIGTDTFTYTVSDGLEESAAAMVTITVTSHAITAAADNYTITRKKPLEVDAASGVLANDSDAEAHELTAILVSQPARGQVFLNADGSFIYMPDKKFKGEDSFTYKVSDGAEESGPATVTITAGQCPAISLYGEDSAQVKMLRKFRDTVLAKSASGKALINLYYRLAPITDSMLDKSLFLQQAARRIIDMLLP